MTRGAPSLTASLQSALRTRKVDVRLPGKGNPNSHGARPVHLIITMIKWIRTSRLSIKNSLCWQALASMPRVENALEPPTGIPFGPLKYSIWTPYNRPRDTKSADLGRDESVLHATFFLFFFITLDRDHVTLSCLRWVVKNKWLQIVWGLFL